MKRIPWDIVWQQSWVGKVYAILLHWWRFSCIFHRYQSLVDFIQLIWRNSLVIRYFQTNQIVCLTIFRKSWIVSTLPLSLFQITHWIYRWKEKIFSNSLTDKGVKSIQSDMQTNPIRYISSLVFSGLVFWVILTLVFGSGFSRPEMMVILLVAFLTWFCSYLETPSFEVIKNSRLIQWFLSWSDMDDQSKEAQ